MKVPRAETSEVAFGLACQGHFPELLSPRIASRDFFGSLTSLTSHQRCPKSRFAKLVKSPKLKFWMSQLELEYHDLLSLFEFLDNGAPACVSIPGTQGACTGGRYKMLKSRTFNWY